MVKHYNTSEIETINFIEQVIKDYPPKMGFHIGNAIKYLARAPHKGSTDDDLYKAENYIHRVRTGRWMHENTIHENDIKDILIETSAGLMNFKDFVVYQGYKHHDNSALRNDLPTLKKKWKAETMNMMIYSSQCPECKRDMEVKPFKRSLHEYIGKCMHCGEKNKVSSIDQYVYKRGIIR